MNLIRRLRARTEALRQQGEDQDMTQSEADQKLDDLDKRLTQTVRQVADTLEQRAILQKRQRDILRRRENGGPASA